MQRRTLFQSVLPIAFAANALERLEAANEKSAGRTALQLASDEDFWFQVRHAFSIDRNIINLNNGSVCPSPKMVQEAEAQYMRVTQMQPSY